MNVLIALDGSLDSEQALALAAELLTGKQTTVTLIHVLPCLYYFGEAGPMPLTGFDGDAQYVAGETMLSAAAHRLRIAGVGPTIKTCLRSGDPADLILSVAGAADADLILLGSSGHYAAQRLLLGSVTSAVSYHARCPVMVVRAGGQVVSRQDVQREAALVN